MKLIIVLFPLNNFSIIKLFSQQIEAVVSKDELQHLVVLCKSEVDSMGRITAGILRLFKLEETIGQAAMNQLTNLGTLVNRLPISKELYASVHSNCNF